MRDIALLILFQAFWSSSYVAMKLALAEMPLGLVMIFRYGLAFAALALCGGLRGLQFTRKHWGLVIAIGVLDFTLSPFLQLRALQMTYATDVAVLVAFEPMLTALLAVIFLRERLQLSTIGAFVIATVGALVMSLANGTTPDGAAMARLFGNLLFLAAILCEGFYSITSRHTTQSAGPLQVITVMIGAGFVVNTLCYHDTLTTENLAAIGAQGWGALAFLGFGCSALAYGGWTYLLKRIPVNQITLSLFLQPVIGGLVAFVVLREVPSIPTLLGAAIIFSSLLLWTLWGLRQRQAKTCSFEEKMLAAS